MYICDGYLTYCIWYIHIYIHTYIYVYICIYIRAGRPSGIESRWRRDFPPVQTGPGVHPASCKMGTGSFPGVNCGRGVLLTTHPLPVPRSRKSRAITLPTLWATQACNRDYFTFTFLLYMFRTCPLSIIWSISTLYTAIGI